ncbi:MAG: hypothetical protein J5733_05640, partial [Bacteroidaceae bacterium]|nr:hypothetical protein [Bacteroidaceae bacterium]
DKALLEGVYSSGSPTGVNTLVLREHPTTGTDGDKGTCLRLIYIGMSKVTPWFPEGKAVVTVKFTEPNPNNRAL